jgi:hypothetical protein
VRNLHAAHSCACVVDRGPPPSLSTHSSTCIQLSPLLSIRIMLFSLDDTQCDTQFTLVPCLLRSVLEWVMRKRAKKLLP